MFHFFIIFNMKAYLPSLILIIALLPFVSPQCIEYRATRCVRCASNQALLNNNCITKINGCIEYLDEGVCVRCNSILFRLDGTKCILNSNSTKVESRSKEDGMTLYQLAAFGDYEQIPLSNLQCDIGFTQCDKFIRNGQYKHFISRSPQPVQFVAVRTLQTWKNYQIIYESSGGGLLLCLINYEAVSSALAIRSIVSIGTSQLIDHCLSYSSSLQCDLCDSNYHLDSGKCIKNIQGCVSYYKSICLACQGFMLLIENRCISECGQLCDTNKITFFQGGFS